MKIMTEKPNKDIPTAKKIENFLKKLSISELGITNEHDLELTIWGLLSGRWTDSIHYRREVGGRLCDMTLDNVAVEVKYIKHVADKDRCTGQIMDYLRSSKDVVVVAIDHHGYLKEIFTDNPKVTVIRL